MEVVTNINANIIILNGNLYQGPIYEIDFILSHL